MAALRDRFEQFMKGLQGVENIDLLMKHSDLPGRQRADYLAFNRNVIIEQKSIEVELDPKVQACISNFQRERGSILPPELTFADFLKVLSEIPDTTQLRKDLRAILTQRIDDVLAKADKQTRDTRKTFVLPHAIGMVIVLNDSVQLLEPDFVVDKAFSQLRRRNEDGLLRYVENQVVVSISEAHRIISSDAVEMIPIETILSEEGNRRDVATVYSELLCCAWAEFNAAFYVPRSSLTRDVSTRDAPRKFSTD